MNAKQLRDYWLLKYNSVFGEKYYNKNFILELTLLKKLLNKYNEFVILEAIDRFLYSANKKKAVIQYFASPKVFESKFNDIIKNSKIIKFKRMLPFYPKEFRDEAKLLLEEYEGYSNAEILSDEEKKRRNEIVEYLERIDYEYNRTKANRR